MTTAANQTRARWRRPWRYGVGYLYVAPLIVWFLAFNLIPMVLGFLIGFTNWNILSPAQSVGWDNYVTLWHDPLFWLALRNTLYYAVVSVLLTTVVSLGLAVALNMPLRSIIVYRTFFFLPAVTAVIAVAMVWRWLYNNDYGLVNWLLSLINLPPVNWLGDPKLAMPAVIVMSVWRSAGFNTIIFLAGLQGVSKEYYEAAELDGASRWQRFRQITVPLVSPTTFFVVVNSLIGSWQVFDQVYAMTRGGPQQATLTIVYYIYSNGFEWFKTGYASAIAYVLFLIILALTMAQFAIQRKWVFYQ
jgi:ABC-type sugar transport system permease subunit